MIQKRIVALPAFLLAATMLAPELTGAQETDTVQVSPDTVQVAEDTTVVPPELEGVNRARDAAARLGLVTDTIQMMIVASQAADAEGKELIRMLAMRYLEELEDLQDELVGLIPDLDSTNVAVDSISQFFRSHLSLIRSLYDRGIDDFEAQTSALRERKAEADTDELGEIELGIRLAQVRLDSNLLGQERTLEAAELMGLEVEEAWADFDAFLRSRAESQVGRLRMADAERDRIEAQLRDAETAGAADAEIATSRALLQVVEQRIDGLVTSLRLSANLLERRDIDASEYRQALVVSTREVTGDVFDPAVAFGLLSDLTDRAVGWVRESGPTVLARLFVVILLVVLFRLGFRIGWWTFQKVGTVQLPRLLSDMVGRMLRPVATILGLIVGLWFLGVDATALVAGLGVAGIIVGLALQDSMANLAAGIFILLYRPYDREDIVTAGGIVGTVKEMGLANTTIVTFDNRRLYVPNRKIWSEVIENRSAEHARRVEFTVSIAYEEDIDRSYESIYGLLKETERVLATPEPYVFASKLADSGVDVTIYAWTRTEDWWPLTTELPRLVRQRFARENIVIPYPHVEIVGSPGVESKAPVSEPTSPAE